MVRQITLILTKMIVDFSFSLNFKQSIDFAISN